ncbi:uncharacterized protein LOC126661205 [Mercurialis annua]|uniref:uncharacterized protein LOC126661205 n=1 Tax=Mercurialis annua TaxID=3986 RepID=UPI0021605968|nr:uncharacterized protein LOC126661205 [Mercurialis annua]
MGAITKVIDTMLFLNFIIMALAVPLMSGQLCLPLKLYPKFLINLMKWYSHEFGDHLYSHNPPNYFRGISWWDLLFHFPLVCLGLYGILGAKPWFNTVCLMYGASISATMAAIIGDFCGAGKGSDTIMLGYYPFFGVGILAMLRGLLPPSAKPSASASAMVNGNAPSTKKLA